MLKDKLAMARLNEISLTAYRRLRNWELNLIEEIKNNLENGKKLTDVQEALLERMYDKYITRQTERTAE